MNIQAHKSSQPSGSSLRLYLWPAATIGLLIIKGTLTLVSGTNTLTARFGTTVYFVVLLSGGVFAIRNAVQRADGSRFFWALMACGYGLWALDQGLYVYYVIGLGIDVPDSSIADPALFLLSCLSWPRWRPSHI
jgi:hypothetical protein